MKTVSLQLSNDATWSISVTPSAKIKLNQHKPAVEVAATWSPPDNVNHVLCSGLGDQSSSSSAELIHPFIFLGFNKEKDVEVFAFFITPRAFIIRPVHRLKLPHIGAGIPLAVNCHFTESSGFTFCVFYSGGSLVHYKILRGISDSHCSLQSVPLHELPAESLSLASLSHGIHMPSSVPTSLRLQFSNKDYVLLVHHNKELQRIVCTILDTVCGKDKRDVFITDSAVEDCISSVDLQDASLSVKVLKGADTETVSISIPTRPCTLATLLSDAAERPRKKQRLYVSCDLASPAAEALKSEFESPKLSIEAFEKELNGLNYKNDRKVVSKFKYDYFNKCISHLPSGEGFESFINLCERSRDLFNFEERCTKLNSKSIQSLLRLAFVALHDKLSKRNPADKAPLEVVFEVVTKVVDSHTQEIFAAESDIGEDVQQLYGLCQSYNVACSQLWRLQGNLSALCGAGIPGKEAIKNNQVPWLTLKTAQGIHGSSEIAAHSLDSKDMSSLPLSPPVPSHGSVSAMNGVVLPKAVLKRTDPSNKERQGHQKPKKALEKNAARTKAN